MTKVEYIPGDLVMTNGVPLGTAKDAKRCIDRALGELQKTDWVSVNEELPEYGEKVVVRNAYYKSDEPWVTFRDIRDLFPKDSNDFREVAGTTSCSITHWKHI